MHRARRVRREEPLDPRLPDPVVGPDGGLGPEDQALLAEGVGLALRVVLGTLTPAERLAFVLHDLFAVPSRRSPPSWPHPRGALLGARLLGHHGRIARIDILADPERLRHLDLPVLDG
jgi:RNA polymerase sigma-70 factor (ECF subfamily)